MRRTYLTSAGQAHVIILIVIVVMIVCDCLLQEPISQSDSEPSPGAPFGIPIIEELLADSFLQQLFAQFFSMLHEEAATVNSKLLAASKQVQQLLQEKLGWEFNFQDVGLDEEEDEYAPTVVQLDGVQL